MVPSTFALKRFQKLFTDSGIFTLFTHGREKQFRDEESKEKKRKQVLITFSERGKEKKRCGSKDSLSVARSCWCRGISHRAATIARPTQLHTREIFCFPLALSEWKILFSFSSIKGIPLFSLVINQKSIHVHIKTMDSYVTGFFWHPSLLLFLPTTSYWRILF